MKTTPFLSAALLFVSSTAFAAHPLITDDTGTQGKAKIQIELNSEISWNNYREAGIGSSETGGETSMAVSYGLTDNIDLVAGMPFQWYSVEENGFSAGEDSGMGDMSLELKWRFFENEDRGFSLALKPGLSIPTGNDEKGFGSGAVSPSIMLIATKEGDFGALHANTGWGRNNYHHEAVDAETRNDIWHASLAAEINTANRLRTVGNIGIETSEERSSSTHPVFLIGGFIYSVSENLDLDIGMKGGLNDAETDTTLLAGLAARF
jgi:hypothetical protein